MEIDFKLGCTYLLKCQNPKIEIKIKRKILNDEIVVCDAVTGKPILDDYFVFTKVSQGKLQLERI